MWWKNKEPEVCGYLNKKGEFFKKEKDRDLSNLKYAEIELYDKINGIFHDTVSYYEIANREPIVKHTEVILKELFDRIYLEKELNIISLTEELRLVQEKIRKLEK